MSIFWAKRFISGWPYFLFFFFFIIYINDSLIIFNYSLTHTTNSRSAIYTNTYSLSRKWRPCEDLPSSSSSIYGPWSNLHIPVPDSTRLEEFGKKEKRNWNDMTDVADQRKINQSYRFKWSDYQNHLSDVVRQLLEEDCMVDVTLSAAGQRIHAHRIVLCACSTLFQVNKLFASNFGILIFIVTKYFIFREYNVPCFEFQNVNN